MNRIYRVIYNQAKNCYVVTSEFARAHTKSAGKATRGMVIAAMTAGALLSGAGMSFAALSTTEVSTSAGGTATVLSGETSDVVTDVSGAGATLTVTKGDGSSTTVVVNNVANAAYAEKAVSDKDGNDISTTYLKTADAETTYATKTELADKANTADVYSKTDADATFATKTEVADKANTADVYSKTDADSKFATVDQLQADVSATNNELANKANTADVYSKTDADATFATKTEVADKANTADVYSKTDADATFATKTELATKANTADVYSKTDADATFATKTELATKADKTEVYTRTEADETFATKTALQAQAEHDQANVDALSGAINNGLAVDENNTLQKITSSVDADGNVTTSVNPADTLIINKDGTNAVTIDTTGLSVGTGTKMDVSGVYAGGSNSTDAAAALNADGSIKGASGKFTVDTSGNLNTHAGKISTEGGSINTGAGDINTAGGQILTAGGTINTSGGAIIGGAITGTSLNTQGGDIIGGNITATGLNTQGGAISSGDINSTGAIHASGKITGNGLDANGGSITGGSLSVTGSVTGHDLTLSGGNLNAGSGTISTTGNVEAGNITSTGTITTSNLEVTGDFATDHMTIGHETNNKTDINKGNISAVNGVITTNIADQSVKASALTFTEDGYKAAVAGHGATSNSGASTEVTMNGVTNTSMDSLGNSSGWSQTSKGQTATTTDSTGARSEVAQSSSQYGSSIYDSSGNLKSYITQRMAQIIQGVTDGTTTTTIDQGPANITNTASNGSITNEAMALVNNATADMTNTVGGKLVNNVTGNMENTVGGNLKNVVTGDVSTEGTNISSKATADMTNTVGGKLVNDVTGNMENNVGGDMKNVVTGVVSTEGKTISNQATESIVDMVGSNVSRTMTGNKIIESVADGNESNVSTRTAKKAMSVVSDGTNTTTVSQLSNGYNVSLKAVDASGNTTKSLTDKKTVDEDVTKMADAASGAFSSRSQKTLSIVDIVKGADGTTNTVSNETSGTTFENSAHNTPVGEGTITRTTIAGNTVKTGSVTMDYAEVMKDLGVHGNAVIDGNTTVGGALGVTGKATFHDDVDIAKNLNVAGNASVTGDVTAASFKVGNETYISAEGINANNKKITNVAPGELSPTSMDAVNGSQLYDTNQRVSRLDSRLDKVGANAAALANLNPLEFDKDTKLNVAAAVGNYKDETAAAVGVYYRPNEDVMVGVSTSFGTGENMVGGGVSFRIGHGGNKSARAATENAIKENEILRREVKELEARMDALLSVLNPNMSREFPDVPANHWAYEAVSRLAGNGIVEGYEDGKYHGERQMTRYEMAEIIYKALSKGVKAEKELIDEFRPELQAMAASNKA